MKRIVTIMALIGWASLASADEVHVVEKAAYGGTVVTLSDTTKYTGSDYTTQAAPTYGGYIFTHWSTSDSQDIDNRDVFGRARDAAKYHLYDTTTLTANYVDASLDSDGDGIADGYELYWYGNLNQNASSDTDGDGYTFVQELQYGMNSHFANRQVAGVVYEDGSEYLYNPEGYTKYVIRSEPEGELFATITGYAKPGTSITTPTCSRLTSFFGYWKKNGAVERDVFGRAKDQLTFSMPETAVECVAVVVDNDVDREKLYWYGTTSVSLESDTDGDGMTFAEEIAAGSNPLMPNKQFAGVVYNETETWQYNPNNKHKYVIRSEPEGELFETLTGYAAAGATVTTPVCSKATTFFAYWTLAGARQSDVFGRAKDQLAFEMPSADVEAVAVVVDDDTLREQMYWYGNEQSLESDTDGDGMTFADEIAAGSNPLMSNRQLAGVVLEDSEDHEMNLQIYEQPQGALVDQGYTQLFYSPIAGNAATSETFANGAPIWPVVADVNDDGLWDLIVCSETATNVFVNVGSKGNPQFCVTTAPSPSCDGEAPSLRKVDLLMNSTAKLDSLSFDVAPVAALSATTNGATLLVSDEEGRIWLYERGAEDVAPYQLPATNYQLLHKVWGGSYAGFAQGLRLAAVDWEDDGDLDCLCGTAEGKLMLLRDPKVGRPTGLVAAAGVDSVKLDWEPNGQSRVRGYRVYRASGEASSQSGEATSSSLQNKEVSSVRSDEDVASPTTSGVASPFALRASTALPTYRDTGLAPATYAYKVSALSRFYTAGNSTPTETESVATEPVTATVGGPTIAIGEPAKTVSGKIEIVVSINNSMNYQAAGTTIEVPYDATKMGYLKTLPSGLSEGLTWGATCDGGGAVATQARRVVVGITAGEVAAGCGVFFTLVFEDLGVMPTVLMGDLDGDGKVDELDLRLLAKLKSAAGRKYTDYQLKAGDFNGNGKLDNADYQALREILKGENKL